MRGKAVNAADVVNWFGITPAYAGKRRFAVAVLKLSQDHPRLCGEKSSIHPQNYTLKGSPPPMRGKGPSEDVFTTIQGITPAYAGKREVKVDWEAAEQDHPRLCGEKRGTCS